MWKVAGPRPVLVVVATLYVIIFQDPVNFCAHLLISSVAQFLVIEVKKVKKKVSF